MADSTDSPKTNFRSIDREQALSLFDYDAESGWLIWRHRDDVRKNINTRRAGRRAGHVHTCTVGKQYIQVRVCGKMIYAHRIIWVICHGEIPPNMQVDHIDGNGANNRIDNLRLASRFENKRNMRLFSTNTSGRVGVGLSNTKKRWCAKGWRDGAPVHIGSFSTFDEASAARESWETSVGFHPNHGSSRPL